MAINSNVYPMRLFWSNFLAILVFTFKSKEKQKLICNNIIHFLAPGYLESQLHFVKWNVLGFQLTPFIHLRGIFSIERTSRDLI